MSIQPKLPSSEDDDVVIPEQDDTQELSQSAQGLPSVLSSDFPYFNTVTSPSQFKRHVPKVGGTGNLAEIRASRGGDSGSTWTTKHLFAFHVVVQGKGPRGTTLSHLEQHVTLKTFARVSDKMKNFLDGPSPGHYGMTEREMVHRYGVTLGQIWAAAAKFANSAPSTPVEEMMPDEEEEEDGSDGRTRAKKRRGEHGDVEEVPTKRIRKRRSFSEFTPSDTMVVASSPFRGANSNLPSSPIDSSQPCIPADASDKNGPREEATLRLATLAIRHLLYNCPPQDGRNVDSSDTDVVVDVRDEPIRRTQRLHHNQWMTAEDDGGLRILAGRQPLEGGPLILFEAKRHFEEIIDDRPVFSNECLAQMVCEALSARLESPESPERYRLRPPPFSRYFLRLIPSPDTPALYRTWPE